MTPYQKFTRSMVVLQGIVWVSVTFIFVFVLPQYGFSSFSDFNDAAKIRAALPWMHFLNWSDLIFAFILLFVVIDLHRQIKTRWPYLLRQAITIILVGTALWFALHDLGFHILSWPAIEQDPASTDFAMDRLLWSVRNTLFFIVSLLATIGNRKTIPNI